MVRTSTSALGTQQPSTLVQHLSVHLPLLSKLYGARFLAQNRSAVKWLAFGPSVRTFMCPPSPLAYPNAKKFCMEDLIPLFHHTACSTNLNVSMSFGGPSWPISISDLSLGTNNGQCVGAIFDIELGTSTSGSDIPSWIVGDTFLVRFIC